MKCSKCGHELDENTEFCSWCGTYTGQEVGTLLNGVRIDTKNYHDPVPAGDDSLFAQLRRNHRANMNGSKTRRADRTNLNGTKKKSAAKHKADHTDLNGRGRGALILSHRILAAVGYLYWFGFLIAFFFGHREDSFVRYHLNAALILNLLGLCANVLAAAAVIGSIIALILSVIVMVGVIWGVIAALSGRMRGMPFVTQFHLIK